MMPSLISFDHRKSIISDFIQKPMHGFGLLMINPFIVESLLFMNTIKRMRIIMCPDKEVSVLFLERSVHFIM